MDCSSIGANQIEPSSSRYDYTEWTQNHGPYSSSSIGKAVLDLFQHTFFSFDLKGTKGVPGTFVKVLDLISIPAERCLFIDDNPTNVCVAESAGISSIQFVDAPQLAAELDIVLAQDRP